MILLCGQERGGAGVGEKCPQLNGLANGGLDLHVLWLAAFWKRNLLCQEVRQARLLLLSVQKLRKGLRISGGRAGAHHVK